MKSATFYLPLCLGAMFFFASCSTIPKGVTAVDEFQKEKYLGKWYEIARFDFKFEKGLNNTTAEYSLRNDGKIKVTNRGYDYEKKVWKEAVGKAKFVQSDEIAKLKVSFFGPFYAGYNVIAIDEQYQYALVAGQSFDYLWILSRTPVIPDAIKQQYLQKAQDLGFDTSQLIWVEHNQQ